MEWTDIRLTVAKADADNAEAVATMTVSYTHLTLPTKRIV